MKKSTGTIVVLVVAALAPVLMLTVSNEVVGAVAMVLMGATILFVRWRLSVGE